MTTSEVIKRAVAEFKDETENYARYLQDKEEEKKNAKKIGRRKKNSRTKSRNERN